MTNSDLTGIIIPRLGPHIDLGEAQLEKYNRVLDFLRSVSYITSGARWKAKMEADDPFTTKALHPSSSPRWMVSEKTPKPAAPEHPAFSAKQIYLMYNVVQRTKYAKALQTHIEELIEPEGLTMPASRQNPTKDPRYFKSGEQWRDTTRRQLNMQNLRIELFTMFLEYQEDEHASLQKVPVFGPGGAVAWSEVRNILLRNDLEVRFQYTIKSLEEAEGFELEYHGVPLSLEADFCVGEDRDIERVRQVPLLKPADEAE